MPGPSVRKMQKSPWSRRLSSGPATNFRLEFYAFRAFLGQPLSNRFAPTASHQHSFHPRQLLPATLFRIPVTPPSPAPTIPSTFSAHGVPLSFLSLAHTASQAPANTANYPGPSKSPQCMLPIALWIYMPAISLRLAIANSMHLQIVAFHVSLFFLTTARRHAGGCMRLAVEKACCGCGSFLRSNLSAQQIGNMFR